MTFFAPLLVALALIAPTVVLAQNFGSTCFNVAFSNPQLSGDCFQANGVSHFTELDLDFCIGNGNGVLRQQVKYVGVAKAVKPIADVVLQRGLFELLYQLFCDVQSERPTLRVY